LSISREARYWELMFAAISIECVSFPEQLAARL
jgi:hypothetical protein